MSHIARVSCDIKDKELLKKTLERLNWKFQEAHDGSISIQERGWMRVNTDSGEIRYDTDYDLSADISRLKSEYAATTIMDAANRRGESCHYGGWNEEQGQVELQIYHAGGV